MGKVRALRVQCPVEEGGASRKVDIWGGYMERLTEGHEGGNRATLDRLCHQLKFP